jgi:hypothetical protein
MTKEEIKQQLQAALTPSAADADKTKALLREWLKLFPGANQPWQDHWKYEEWLAHNELTERAFDEWNAMVHAIHAERQ